MPNQIEFDRSTIQHLADLARLHLTADRLPLLRQRLQRLVDAFGALAQEPDQVADPTAASPDPGLPETTPGCLRPDQPMPPLRQDQALANASKTAGGAFLVPRVIDA